MLHTASYGVHNFCQKLRIPATPRPSKMLGCLVSFLSRLLHVGLITIVQLKTKQKQKN
jgi:hypothetical protein